MLRKNLGFKTKNTHSLSPLLQVANKNVDDGEERSGNQIAGDNVLPEHFFTTAFAAVGGHS